MWTSVRATAAATLVAVAATTGVAAAVDAPPQASDVMTPAPTAIRETTTTSAFPAITTADLDPALLEAASSDADGEQPSVVEVIELTVIGGDLELVTEHATVTLERVAGWSRDWVGSLPAVRVIDARGTHEGWTVRWTAEDVSSGSANRVRIKPGAPVVVAGLPDGIVAGSAGPSGGSRGRTLFGATAGYGGGTYEAGGTVTLRLPPSVDADRVVVELSFSLG